MIDVIKTGFNGTFLPRDGGKIMAGTFDKGDFLIIAFFRHPVNMFRRNLLFFVLYRLHSLCISR